MRLAEKIVLRFAKRISASRFFRDSATLSVGTGIGQAITLLSAPILARLYDVESFGVLAMFLSVQALLTVVTTGKLEQLIAVADSADMRAAMYRVIVIAGGICSMLLSAAAWFYRHEVAGLLNLPKLAAWLPVIPFTAWLAGCALGGQYLALQERRFGAAATGEVACRGIQAGFGVGLGISVGGATSGLLVSIPLGYFVKALWLMRGGVGRRVMKMASQHSAPGYRDVISKYGRLAASLVLSHGMSQLSTHLLVLALGSIHGGRSLGFYALAVRIVGAPMQLVASAMGDVYRQRATLAYHECGRFDELMKRMVVHLIWISVPGAVLLILVMPWLIPALLGHGWEESTAYAQIIVGSSAFGFVSTVVDKSAIIVGAGSYIFIWHAMRLVATAGGVFLSWHFGFGPLALLGLVCSVNVVFYVVDLFVGFRLSEGRRNYIQNPIT